MRYLFKITSLGLTTFLFLFCLEIISIKVVSAQMVNLSGPGIVEAGSEVNLVCPSINPSCDCNKNPGECIQIVEDGTWLSIFDQNQIPLSGDSLIQQSIHISDKGLCQYNVSVGGVNNFLYDPNESPSCDIYVNNQSIPESICSIDNFQDSFNWTITIENARSLLVEFDFEPTSRTVDADVLYNTVTRKGDEIIADSEVLILGFVPAHLHVEAQIIGREGFMPQDLGPLNFKTNEEALGGIEVCPFIPFSP